MNNHRFRWLVALLLSAALVISGCSSSGGGDSTGSTTTGELTDDGIDTVVASTPTTVAGKVTLSSVVTAKARQKAAIAEALKRGKPGSKAYNKAMAKAIASYKILDDRALPSRPLGAGFANGQVYLYNASHPEWLYPVAETTTDENGSYTLETLTNADLNGNAYTDGDPIPGGNYTLLAFTINKRTNRPKLVALQSVVSEFAGNISGVDLVAQSSTAEPTITTMLGVNKNTNGTQTWGGEDLELAPNAAIQVAFSMAMNRQSMDEIGLVFSSSDGSAIPQGQWTLSADWFTATYYLKEGEEWNKGVTYTLTVNGADAPANADGDSGEDIAVFNVFGKSLKLTGVGTFTIPAEAVVDTQAPTAQIASPTLAQTAGKIDITTPLRIASNERMDVNGLRLKADPSLGAQPGVLFVGKNDDGLYEYEFLLGEPMKLATTYDVTVWGGKDLAGNTMNELTVSFSTVEQTEGVIAITEDATEEEIATANAQAEVKDIFGKWVRAFNDRNLPQLQSLMSGDFFMEYNTANGFDRNDINRDGLYDLSEFSDMIADAFIMWDYCGVTISGKVADTINIVGDVADFEFNLTAESEIKTQECQQAAPNDDLFATLQKVNGAWYMVRASEGIDTRGQEIQQATLLELVAPEDAAVHDFEASDLTFEWKEVADAAAYAWIVVDSRNPQAGFALILPPTMTSIDVPSGIDTLLQAETIADVSEEFGFTDKFNPRPGVELYWQVAALGSNTVNDVLNDRATDLPKDVTAISELYRVKVAGEYVELGVKVFAQGAEVEFSEFIWGYDVGDAGKAKIKIKSPAQGATQCAVVVDGNTHKEYTGSFDADGVCVVDTLMSNNGPEPITDGKIFLNQGNNNVGVFDGIPDWMQREPGTEPSADQPRPNEKWFNIVTTGGIAPVISISTVTAVNADAVETELVNDGWDFYQSADAIKVKIAGAVDMTALPEGANVGGLDLNVWNDKVHANAYRRIDVNTDGSFTAEVEVYNGENWVGVHLGACTGDGQCQDFNANFGVKTDAGSEYVPPISEVVVSYVNDAGEEVVINQKENWGNGGMWDVSEAAGNVVTITGIMEAYEDPQDDSKTPRYNVGSDGGWMDDRLSVVAGGVFTFEVELFNGWNYVGINDVEDNWFNLDLYTTAGKAVIRPEITTVAGAPFTGGDVTTDQCTATIEGTAMEGEVRLNWNGQIDKGTGPMFYWEEIITEAVADADGNVTFSAKVPLVGSSDPTVFTDNFVDVFDKNWNWMGVRIIATGNCDYTPPAITVDGMTTDGGTELVKEDPPRGWYDENNAFHEEGARFMDPNAADPYMPIAANSVTITGTSTVAGRLIGAEMFVCNNPLKLPKVAASDTANGDGLYEWSMTLDVYPGYNNINISDGPNWYNVELDVDPESNSNTPPPPVVSLTVFDGTKELSPQEDPFAPTDDPCAGSGNMYDAGSATTVTIKGVVSEAATQDGQGEWRSDGSFGRFDIVDGAFEFTVDLYDGFNWIDVNDADWNHANVQIQASNGNQRPQFVKMEAADGNAIAHGDALAAGTHTITGTVYMDPVNKTGVAVGFKPERVDGWYSTCGFDTDPAMNECIWQDVSSDPEATSWGAMPITLGTDADGNITFSFETKVLNTTMFDPATNAETTVPSELRIELRADGVVANGNWEGHGQEIVLNKDPNCPDCSQERIWKPGAKAAVNKVDAVKRAAADRRFKALRSRGN